MKYCKICHAKNRNSAEECVECGAEQFVYKCPRCGTVFSDRRDRCPECDLRAGATKKVCPDCGTVYFGRECPDCGYSASSSRSAKKESSSKMLPLIIGGAALLIAIIVLVIVLITKGKKDAAAELEPASQAVETQQNTEEAPAVQDTGAVDAAASAAEGEKFRKYFDEYKAFAQEYYDLSVEVQDLEKYKESSDKIKELNVRAEQLAKQNLEMNYADNPLLSEEDAQYCAKLDSEAKQLILDAGNNMNTATKNLLANMG